MTEKDDAVIFRRQLQKLKRASWLRPAQRWWPSFLFHHTNITNVISILESGALLSRAEIEHNQAIITDSASPDIISNTATWVKNCVRFYFRPLTPTSYRMEGFRPITRRWKGAHCPVPIYLLFDFEKIVCRSDAKFSTGNLAGATPQIFSQGADFEKLPFQLIYHDGPHDPQDRSIVFHQQAEVIIPKQVGLEHLRQIWCRSQAEYETLHYFLSPLLWQRWQDKITARTDYSLFKRKWVYVDTVIPSNSQIIFRFNPCGNSLDAGPFNVYLEIREIATGQKYTWRDQNRTIDRKIVFDLSNLKSPDHYSFELRIDGKLAYANEFFDVTDIPF